MHDPREVHMLLMSIHNGYVGSWQPKLVHLTKYSRTLMAARAKPEPTPLATRLPAATATLRPSLTVMP